MGHLFAHKTKIDRRFDSAQRMSGSHPLLQVHRVIKELRVALPLSHHDGNTLLAHLPWLGYFFLSSQADLGNTPSTFDISEEHGPPPCSGRSQTSRTILRLHPCVLARTLAQSNEKDSVSEFVQLLELLADYTARRDLN